MMARRGDRIGSPGSLPGMRITMVVGNPKAKSRTLRAAAAVADAVAVALPGRSEIVTVDLAEVAGRIFDWEDRALTELTASVAASDVAVIASPTYKATYTGLLKAFLDRYGNNGLAGVTAVPVMVGAAPIHALAPEVHLRPLLVELGASVPSRGLYVMESQLEDLGPVVGDWAGAAAPLIAAVVGPGR
jgi:FMN reductase